MRSPLAADRGEHYRGQVLALTPTPVPLVNWDDGTVRVAGTRVLLEIIVGAFRNGATPEEIAQQYPSVTLNAVYAVIAWVLENTDEVDAYVTQRTAIAADENLNHDIVRGARRRRPELILHPSGDRYQKHVVLDPPKGDEPELRFVSCETSTSAA